jgi:hypothetical protein
MKRILVVVVGTLSMLLGGCGGGQVHISSPADGQVYQISSGFGGYQVPQQLVVTLDDTDAYQDTQIRIIGQERLPQGLLNCSGGSGTPLICYIGPAQGGSGFNTQYAVLIKATRGDFTDTRIVYFQQGTQTMTTQPPTR